MNITRLMARREIVLMLVKRQVKLIESKAVLKSHVEAYKKHKKLLKAIESDFFEQAVKGVVFKFVRH
jgi:hypothetical protein